MISSTIPRKTMFVFTGGLAYRIGLLVFAYMAISSPVLSQTRHLRFNHLTVKDGLSQSDVYCLLQDRNGFMWLGTSDGLNRFDGYEFRIFRPETGDPHSLSGSTVRSLCEDRQGHIWVGTEAGGVNRYDPSSERFVRFRKQAGHALAHIDKAITAIIEDRGGRLWFAVGHGGLYRLDPNGESKHYPKAQPGAVSEDGFDISTVFEDSAGRIWVGSNYGLSLMDEQLQGRFTNMLPSDGNNNSCWSLFEDHEGFLWAGTWRGGVVRYGPDRKSYRRFRFGEGLDSKSNEIRAICQDRNNIVWLATGTGIQRFDRENQHFINYRHDPTDPGGLGHNRTRALCLDRDGLLWIGTGAGADYFSPLSFQFGHARYFPDDAKGLSGNGVAALLEDRQGYLWIGTQNGLDRFDPDSDASPLRFVHDPETRNSLSENEITVLYEDRHSVLWVGTVMRGLNRIQPDRTSVERLPYNQPGQVRRRILSMTEDRNENLWVGTDGEGFFRGTRLGQAPAAGVRFERFRPTDPGQPGFRTVYCILEDSSGRVWAGTAREGLNRIDQGPDHVTHFGVNEGLSDEWVYALCEFAGALWVGTQDGLNRFDPDSASFQVYRKEEGLPNGVIQAILPDDAGFLWVSTNQGLARFDPQDQTFVNFDQHDGLQANEFKPGSRWRRADGQLLFGGIDGLTFFFPDHLEKEPSPRALLTGLRIENKPVWPSQHGPLKTSITTVQSLIFSYEDMFSFSFAAPHFANPRQTRYRYRLDGLKDWIVSDYTNRRATYTNLYGGSYHFQVQAATRGNPWPEEWAEVAVTITPPFWRSDWANLMYVVAIAAMIFWYQRLQARKLARKHRQLENERRVTWALREADRQKDEQSKTLARTQEQLLLHDKMASLGTLTAGIGHEINNPTSFVRISAQNLQIQLDLFREFLFRLAGDDVEKEVVEAFEEEMAPLFQNVRTIVDGTQRIIEIVGHLRIFSQQVRDRSRLTDVKECLQSTLALVRPKFKEQVAFVEDYQDEMRLPCDRGEINQVFMNLIVNACQAIIAEEPDPDGPGTLTIRTSIQESWGVIRIQDSGCGIPMDIRNRIFEPFFTTKKEFDGTGLGLSISYGIIKAHGGRLKVEESSDQGTTFAVLLPLEIPPKKP